MRITILALGTPGDVQPVIALGHGLQRAGHIVRLAAPPASREQVSAQGFDYTPIGHFPEGDANRAATRWTTRAALHAIYQYFRSLLNKSVAPVWPVRIPFIERVMDDCWTACQAADLILLCRHIPWFYQVVEQTGTPYLLWDIYPFSVTREFPNLHFSNFFRRWPRIGIMLCTRLGRQTGLNSWTHRVVHRFLFDISVRFANNWRQERMHLDPVMDTTPFATRWGEPATLYAFSPAVAAPKDWAASHHLTGYWFLNETHDAPPLEVVEFLSAGTVPICFCFAIPDPRNHLATIMEMLHQTKHRAIVVAPRESVRDLTIPASVLVTDSISRAWLFQRVSLVVHQGDTTTTGEVLQAGVPSVVALSGRGMLFWADRLYKLGVTPLPIAKGKLTPQRLAKKIRAVLDTPYFRERAIAVSQSMKNEDGVRTAVEVLQNNLVQTAFEQRGSPTCS